MSTTLFRLFSAAALAALAFGPAPAPAAPSAPAAETLAFLSEDGRYRFEIDFAAAPALAKWCEERLAPVVRQWYPKIAEMLASDGFRPPRGCRLRFKDGMNGTPAYCIGEEIHLNRGWFAGQLGGEALGCVVHEMTHVVQQYGRGGRPAPPGWITEGIADYVRWFCFEPQSGGAVVRKRSNPRPDGSYRVTANFLDWCVRRRSPCLVKKLNAVSRDGRYREACWKIWTGKTLAELGEEWRRQLPE